MKPTIGRIVHYYPESISPRPDDFQPNAAIVTRVNGNGTFNIWVCPTGETISKSGTAKGVRMGDPATDRTGRLFCWPPREDQCAAGSVSQSMSPEEAAAARAAQDGQVNTVEAIAEAAAGTTQPAASTESDTIEASPPAVADSQALNNGGNAPN